MFSLLIIKTKRGALIVASSTGEAMKYDLGAIKSDEFSNTVQLFVSVCYRK